MATGVPIFDGIVDGIGTIQQLFGNQISAAAGAVDDAVTGGVGSDIVGNLTGKVPTDYSLGQSKYDFTSRVFPLDIGSKTSYNGHYMVININVQNNTKLDRVSDNRGNTYKNFTTFGDLNSFSSWAQNAGEISKTDALRYNIDNNYRNSEDKSLGLNSDLTLNRPRYTRRIVESIALYMPNAEMTFTDQHDYQNISLTKIAASAASTGVNIIGQGIGALLGSEGGPVGAAIGAGIGSSVAGGVNSAMGALGGLAGVAGTPINPKVEILFANTFQREFSFDFLFAPSNQEESEAIQQIIRTLRFHAAPELRPDNLVGTFFWVPPSEFDITFYNRGKENKAIPRINTCVLKQVDVSYAPTGTFATFSNGHPVQIRMVLRFTETEVNHKLRVLQGF